MMLDPARKRELLELMERERQAKEALAEALAEAAADLEIDKAVLKKCLSAWFKGEAWKLRAGAQLTLDLLDDGQARIPRVSDAKRNALHRQAKEVLEDVSGDMH